MRQRPVDVNQTTLFVDTQPRPVNRSVTSPRSGNKDRHGRRGGHPDGESGEMTESRAWTLLAVAAVMLLAGAYLVRGNHYAHLHRRIEEAYYDFLDAWDREYRSDFVASRWELLVEGVEQPLPLQPLTMPSKRVRVPAHRQAAAAHANAGAAAGAGAAAAGLDDPHRDLQPVVRRNAQSSLLEFRMEKLLDTLYPTRVPLLDRQKVAHSKLWRPLIPELRLGREMTLRVTDGRTGAVSLVELGRVVFSRERTVPGGGEARCMYDQLGRWQPDATCSVTEYLAALCVKVARNATTGAFAADSSLGGGAGCWPVGGWEPGVWRRLDERRNRANGRVYLPLSAQNATVISVRHAHDPAILEADIVKRVTPNAEHQILFHAVGLALCFLAAVLLLSVGAFATPALLRRARTCWDWMRGRGPRGRPGGGKDSDDEYEADLK